MLLFSSCSNEPESEGSEDYLMGKIRQNFSEISSAYNSFPELAEGMQPARIMPIPDSKLSIVLDNTGTDVVLIDPDGAELSRAGGRGRGPGEFEALGPTHQDRMGNIYVMDLMLRRFQVFEVDIERKELTYQKTINMLPIDAGFSLLMREVFITEQGNFGIFNQTADYQTGENKHYLYTVDDELHPDERLLELPGDEKVQIDEMAFINNLVGESVFWDVDGEWFYYLTSHSPVIYKYHLLTGDRETVNLPGIVQKRENTSVSIEYLKDLYSSFIEWNSAIKDEIEQKSELPIFQDILVQDNKILLNLFYAGGEHGLILCINEETGEVNYLKTPPLFRRISLRNDNIYGIDFTNANTDGRLLMYITMDM